MTLHIPNDVLQHAGITEDEARTELACRLFETGRLTLFFAAKLAGIRQADFEDLLLERGIPIYRYTEGDLESDLGALRRQP